MKKYIFLFIMISFLFPNETISQTSIFQPKKNRKTLGYLTSAKKELKSKNYYKAIANASAALNSKPKKRQVKKINSVMEKGYASFLQNNQEKIEALQKTSTIIEKDEHINQRKKIINHYLEFIYVQNELAKVPADLMGKIAITIDQTDHSAHLTTAEESLAEGKKEMMEIHYVLGKDMFDKSTNRIEFKQAGRQLAKIFRYESKYKDAADLYLTSKEKGKTKMSVHFFHRPSQKVVTKMKGAELENKITQKLYKKTNSNPFFSLYPNDSGGMIIYDTADGMVGYNKAANKSNTLRDKREGVHYQLTGLILECEIVHNQKDLDPTTSTKTIKKEDSKKDGKDDPGIKVSAKVQVHSKTSYANISVSYKIIDTATGEVLKTRRIAGSDPWFYEYGTYTGDKRALSRSDKLFVDKKPKSPPSDQELIKDASIKLAESIAKEVQEIINSKDL